MERSFSGSIIPSHSGSRSSDFLFYLLWILERKRERKKERKERRKSGKVSVGDCRSSDDWWIRLRALLLID